MRIHSAAYSDSLSASPYAGGRGTQSPSLKQGHKEDITRLVRILDKSLCQTARTLRRMDNGSRVLRESNLKVLMQILKMRARFLALQKALRRKNYKKMAELILESAQDSGPSFGTNFIIS